MEISFQRLADKFKDKSDLVDDLEVEVKFLSREDIDGLKKNIGRLKAENSQQTDEVSHMQASVDEICEEVVPLQ